MKKLVTMALTAAMVLSMSVSALANDSASGTVTESGDNGKTTVTTITEVKVGDVTISTASADMTTEEVLEKVIGAATEVVSEIKEEAEKAMKAAGDEKVVTPFVEVQMKESDRSTEDGKFHPTLQNDAIAVKDGKTPRVFGYHLRKDGTLELVEGTVNTEKNTVQFALESLSPIALVIVYETVQTPAQSPAQTTTQTTPVSSPATSPNTGANESAALLCLVAVVAFGAAAVVTMKPRKRV